jgi:hypothetical protein
MQLRCHSRIRRSDKMPATSRSGGCTGAVITSWVMVVMAVAVMGGPSTNPAASSSGLPLVQAAAGPVDLELVAPPAPYTQSATTRLTKAEVWIHGVRIKYATRSPQHISLLQAHIEREINGYALVKDAILNAKIARPEETPLVMDVGANHGLYSLFAAALGADVITLEPQEHLCRVINTAMGLNDFHSAGTPAGQITLYHNAALNSHETVTMADASVAEVRKP